MRTEFALLAWIAFAASLPCPASAETLRVGAGAGLRYLTAIGPIRVDIGVPLNPQRGDPAYGLYVGIGQAF